MFENFYHWRVNMVSAGGVKHVFTDCTTRFEAEDVVNDNHGYWIDENGFEWGLEVEYVH